MVTTSSKPVDPPDKEVSQRKHPSSGSSAGHASDNRRSKDHHNSPRDPHRHHHHSRSRDHTAETKAKSSGNTTEKSSNDPLRRGLRIFIGTANLGNAAIDPSSLSSWLPSHGRVRHVLHADISSSDDNGDDDKNNVKRGGKSKRIDDAIDSHGKLEVIVIGTQESLPGNRPAVTSGITSFMTGATTASSTKRQQQQQQPQQPPDSTFQNVFGTLGKPVDDLVHSLGKPADEYFDSLLSKTGDLLVASSKNSDLPLLSGHTKQLRTSIRHHLGDDYQTVVEFQRGEMMLFVFLRKDLLPASRVESIHAENTGLGGILANKGGIAAVLTVASTKLYFLTVHLQPHEGRANFDKRNADVEEILAGTGGDPSVMAHHAFVFGDLNYRVAFPTSTRGIAPTKEESWAVCANLIRRKDWKGLRESDELEKALREKKILCGFRTPMCKFCPTFKLERRSGFHYDKKRTPSYTDRILWKSMQQNRSIEPLIYEPISSFATSDHKPMRGLFFLPERQPLNLHRDEKRMLQLTFKKLKCKSLVPTPDLFQSDLDTFLQIYCEPQSLLSQPKPSSKLPKPPKTKTIQTSDRPSWPNEVHKLIINVFSDEDLAGSRLFVKSVLENKVLGNATIGIAMVDLEDLVRKSLDASEWEEEGVETVFFRNGKEVGKCFFDLLATWLVET